MPDTAPSPRRSDTKRRRVVLRGALAALALGMAPRAYAAEPAMPAGLSTPAQPTALPAFDLPTTAGKPLNSTALKGQVLVIRFWASW